MMSTKETSALEEEEGENVEEGRDVGATGAASLVSTCGRFTASYATLLWIDSLLMEPMTGKKRGGIETYMCVRMHVIAEGKMSLSRVAVS